MQAQTFPSVPNRSTSLVGLICSVLFERAGYYGMRALLMLYMIKSFEFGDAEAVSVYGIFSSAIALSLLPAGLLSDLLLGQKRSVLIGGAVLAGGIFVLMIPQVLALYAGLILIVVGSSLVRLNLAVLLGRMYAKPDNRRDIGFGLYYIGINIGAVLGTVMIAAVGETFGWMFGFALAGLSVLIGLGIFAFIKEKIPMTELEEPEIDAYSSDTPGKGRVGLIAMLAVLAVLFWGLFESSNIPSYELHSLVSNNLGLSHFVIHMLNPAFLILLSPILIFYMVFRTGRQASDFIGIGFLLLGIFILLMKGGLSGSMTPEIAILGGGFVMAIGELFFSFFAYSWVTRLAPVKLSSFFLALILSAPFLANGLGGVMGKLTSFSDSILVYLSIVAFLVGVALLVLRKKIKSASDEVY